MPDTLAPDELVSTTSCKEPASTDTDTGAVGSTSLAPSPGCSLSGMAGAALREACPPPPAPEPGDASGAAVQADSTTSNSASRPGTTPYRQAARCRQGPVIAPRLPVGADNSGYIAHPTSTGSGSSSTPNAR